MPLDIYVSSSKRHTYRNERNKPSPFRAGEPYVLFILVPVSVEQDKINLPLMRPVRGSNFWSQQNLRNVLEVGNDRTKALGTFEAARSKPETSESARLLHETHYAA